LQTKVLLEQSEELWQSHHCMPAALTHRFTVEEYYRMAETGILKRDARVELIDGEIVDMMPIGPFHSGALSQLSGFFQIQAKGRWLVWNQSPLHLDDHHLPEPDLMLLRPSTDHYKSAHPTAENVYLVIEVADSSVAFDQNTKLPMYARFGIEEVWILNVPQKQLEVYRQPHFLGYALKEVLREGKASPGAFPDAAISVLDLLS
jgi:Uma2 family endonuclease